MAHNDLISRSSGLDCHSRQNDGEWNCIVASSGCASLGNSDITGLGVLLAFLVVASATLAASWIDFMLSSKHRIRMPSRVDRNFLHGLNAIKFPTLPQSWTDTNLKMILLFSDQVIVIGIAVLIAGFQKSQTLSIYHFEIILWEAWLASNCHQVTLLVSQEYFLSHPTILAFRLIAMTIMFVMLFVTLSLFAVAPNGAYSLDSGIHCLWSDNTTTPRPDAIIALLLLGVNYTARLMKAFERPAAWSRLWFREKPSALLKILYNRTANGGNIPWWNIIPFWIFVVYCLGRAVYDMCESRVFQLLWLSWSFGYGCAKLIMTRDLAPKDYQESDWAFGQILAMLALAVPVLGLPQIYYGMSRLRPKATVKSLS